MINYSCLLTSSLLKDSSIEINPRSEHCLYFSNSSLSCLRISRTSITFLAVLGLEIAALSASVVFLSDQFK